MGLALVPYYSHILPILSIIRGTFRDENLGDKISYSTSSELVKLIDQTVGLMERMGGSDAYLNIKFSFPTYESCVLN